MIELRFAVSPDGLRSKLQWRQATPMVMGGPPAGPWTDVPMVVDASAFHVAPAPTLAAIKLGVSDCPKCRHSDSWGLPESHKLPCLGCHSNSHFTPLNG